MTPQRKRLLARLRRLRRVVAATRFEAGWQEYLATLDEAIALLAGATRKERHQ